MHKVGHLATMKVDLRLASEDDQRTFCNLWEFYLYDLSEFDPKFEVDEYGQYSDAPIHYWKDPHLSPFLIYVDEVPSGFVLVNQSGDRNRIGQFFVMRKYRGRGVGESASILSFDRFPGNWIVGVTSSNLAAQSFWRRVISRYTSGNFEENQDKDGIDLLFSSNSKGH